MRPARGVDHRQRRVSPAHQTRPDTRLCKNLKQCHMVPYVYVGAQPVPSAMLGVGADRLRAWELGQTDYMPCTIASSTRRSGGARNTQRVLSRRCASRCWGQLCSMPTLFEGPTATRRGFLLAHRFDRSSVGHAPQCKMRVPLCRAARQRGHTARSWMTWGAGMRDGRVGGETGAWLGGAERPRTV